MATNFVTALGGGSGIDTKQLVQDLVALKKGPRSRADRQ